MWNEPCTHGLTCKKTPYTRKEPCIFGKRPVCIERDVYMWNERCTPGMSGKSLLAWFTTCKKHKCRYEQTFVYIVRDSYVWKETFTCGMSAVHTKVWEVIAGVVYDLYKTEVYI